MANTGGLPDTFDLTFEHGRTRRFCRVVWRTADKVGVKFKSGEALAEISEKQLSLPFLIYGSCSRILPLRE